MRAWSRLLLALAVVLAAIGFGVPDHGTLIGGVRAERAARVRPAGVSQDAVFAVVVSVSPNPTEAFRLTTVTVTSAVGTSCTLAIHLPDNSVAQNVATGTITSSGSLVLTFTPGSNMIGADTATVVCSSINGVGTGYAAFSVLPAPITPSATPVPLAPGVEQATISSNTALVPGSIFSIVGQGFPPGATITFVGFILAQPYAAVVQPNGTLVIPNIMVPYGEPPGSYVSTLQNSANTFERAVVAYTIAPLAPVVTLNTASAAHGDTVSISGTGFGGNEVVDVNLGPDMLLTVKADNGGAFSGTFVVPGDIPLGSFSVSARGESTGAANFAPLTISAVSPFAPTSTATGTVTATPLPPGPTLTPTSTPVPLGPTQAGFFLPEGTTANGEQVTYTILNPATVAAHVSLELVFADGTVTDGSALVPAQALAQVSANSLVPPSERGQAFSAQVTADQPVSVSRSIVRPAHDGTLSSGTERNYHYQYFAEGYTGRGFNETLALFNSANANANVELRLLPSSGAPPIIRRYIIGPLRRYTIDVNALAPRQSVGAIVISDIELSVERTLTFGSTGNGQTTVAGADAPQTTWYFAEGSTRNDFSEFLTLLNPTNEAAAITADFYDPHGKRIGSKTIVVAARARGTIDVGKIVSATSVGAVVSSSVPILAERTMYRGPLTGARVIGSGSFGRSSLSSAYAFPSGDTSPGNAEFLLLLNPTASPLAIQLQFFTMSGAGPTFTTVVPAHSRTTIDVARDVPGVAPGPHGVVVRSTSGTPFMAEQSEYLGNFSSALSSIGVPVQGGGS